MSHVTRLVLYPWLSVYLHQCAVLGMGNPGGQICRQKSCHANLSFEVHVTFGCSETLGLSPQFAQTRAQLVHFFAAAVRGLEGKHEVQSVRPSDSGFAISGANANTAGESRSAVPTYSLLDHVSGVASYVFLVLCISRHQCARLALTTMYREVPANARGARIARGKR